MSLGDLGWTKDDWAAPVRNMSHEVRAQPDLFPNEVHSAIDMFSNMM